MTTLTSQTSQKYTIKEEVANSITHGVGFLLSLGVLGTLSAFSSIYGDVWHITGCAIFAFAMIFLYGASTLYHAIQNTKAKSVLRFIDHSAIFVLIAGTYTPFAFVTLRGWIGWTLFGIVWGITLFGIIFQGVILKKKRYLSVILYIMVGCVVIVAIKPLFLNLHSTGFYYLIIGGAFYIFGTIFYLWKRIPYNHAIWHIFVLAGTMFHFFTILFYVVPVLV